MHGFRRQKFICPDPFDLLPVKKISKISQKSSPFTRPICGWNKWINQKKIEKFIYQQKFIRSFGFLVFNDLYAIRRRNEMLQ